jgi:SsrA-binding protein
LAKKPNNPLPTIENRKARFDYFIEETMEVGIALSGSEVKSVRAGKVSLAEGFVRANDKPICFTLHQVNIGEYQPAGTLGHKPVHVRLLLAHKREVIKWAKRANAKGMTIVPLKMYFKGPWAKLEIGLGKGKAAHDKRDTMSKRDAQRDIDRAMTKKSRHF